MKADHKGSSPTKAGGGPANGYSRPQCTQQQQFQYNGMIPPSPVLGGRQAGTCVLACPYTAVCSQAGRSMCACVFTHCSVQPGRHKHACLHAHTPQCAASRQKHVCSRAHTPQRAARHPIQHMTKHTRSSCEAKRTRTHLYSSMAGWCEPPVSLRAVVIVGAITCGWRRGNNRCMHNRDARQKLVARHSWQAQSV